MCFNTQPPEGGWDGFKRRRWQVIGFNTQPPEGGWALQIYANRRKGVSTHSRPKAAGNREAWSKPENPVSTHSRPKAAAQPARPDPLSGVVSTHSRPKAAGWQAAFGCACRRFNTQPPEGGCQSSAEVAAECTDVSTHSRPKAAGAKLAEVSAERQFQHTAARRRLFQVACVLPVPHLRRFNTQPPEGGCYLAILERLGQSVSTHSRPKAAAVSSSELSLSVVFQHTAARRRLRGRGWCG